ncbi:MAG: 50S ribosomal protein L6 [Polyangiaceae bacterium]|nr:50S ribosomal protein L6 [Polyangiaceae bacterium]
MTQLATPTAGKQSRLGKRPIPIPKGVTVTLGADRVDVQGPKGKLGIVLPPSVSLAREGDTITVTSSATERDGRRLQGLGRALVASLVQGAAVGFERTLELHGTGYRAELKGRSLHLQLGFSHPTVYEIPAELTCTIPPESKGTLIILTSANKSLLGQVAADLRGVRPAEPYGGKGVRYRGETIRRKAGKAGKGRK